MKVSIPETDPISEGEQEILDKIKEELKELMDRGSLDDSDFLRIIRGCVNEEDQFETAKKVITDILNWRETENIDELASQDLPKRDDLVKTWPHGFHGVSKDNHVIYIDRPGMNDSDYFHKNFTMEEFENIHIQTMEWLGIAKRRLNAKLGINHYKHVVILDLTNVGLSHFGSRVKEPFKKITNIDSTKYPETLHQMFIVNPSFMFRTIWAIVSVWLDESTKQRIHFLKNVKDLQKYIDADQLPDFLGGTVTYSKEQPAFVHELKTMSKDENNHDEIFSNLQEASLEKFTALKEKREKITQNKEAEDTPVDSQNQAGASDATNDEKEVTKEVPE